MKPGFGRFYFAEMKPVARILDAQRHHEQNCTMSNKAELEHERQFPAGRPAPRLLFADDATSADQVALAVCEILGERVIATDAGTLAQTTRLLDECAVRVINSATRALSKAEALARNQFLSSFVVQGELPLLQIDSRLRGIGHALKGFYHSLDFEFLLLIPAEPELDRIVQNGVYYHLVDGIPVPFHQSSLAKHSGGPFHSSDLRSLLAVELELAEDSFYSVTEAVVARGPAAIADFIRNIRHTGKFVVVPDVTCPKHFESVILALGELQLNRILTAGSRTFLRSLFSSFKCGETKTRPLAGLSQSIDRRKRGAPLAVISSLEPAMNAQIEYARHALGPNLVTVVFDSSVVLADGPSIQQEINRAQTQVLESLKAMRPVLLHTSRAQAFVDSAVQRQHMDAFCQIMAGAEIHRHVTALFISGGQTAESVKAAIDLAAVEIRGAFQPGIPWGVPVAGPWKDVPVVTKGGRMGEECVLFEFFEQGHALPRANILPVITPLTSGKDVDEAAIEALVGHLVRLGTTDVFPVGNAGEFRFLSNQQRLKALEVFAQKARGKLRVFAGITGDSEAQTKSNYEAAGKLGIHAAVIMPLYFLKSSDDIGPFIATLESTQSNLPVILYNNPERTNGQHISYEAVEALSFPVVAIKDSSGDLDRFDRYAKTLPVYEGQQRQFLEGYQHGGRGAIGIIGHVSRLPNEFFAPTTTSKRREEIAKRINDLSRELKQDGAEVAAYKFVLSLLGFMEDTVASNEAERELSAAQRQNIRAINAELVSRMSSAGPL